MGILTFCGSCVLAFAAASMTDTGAASVELTLEQAVTTALSVHRALQAAGVHVSGLEGLKKQASLRPNPELFLQTENWRFTGVTGFQPGQDVDLFAYVSQPFEAGGKRARRVEVARQDIRVAELERKVLEWRIRQEVRQAFLRALLAQTQLEIVRENVSYFQQVVEYHRVRVEQGAMAEADLLKVRLEQERLALDENSAKVEADRTRIELLRSMGVMDMNPDYRLAQSPPPAAASTPLTLPGLLERARAKRPELLLGQALVERAQAQLSSQQAMAKPDWSLVMGYKRTGGYDTILAGVAIPLPVANRNEGNILSSAAEVERARLLVAAAEAQIQAELHSALAGIRRRHAMVRQMERGMVERAEESWRISLAAYREGGTDLLRLLDAQRVRNEVHLLFTRTQMDYRLSLAELERAVGDENLSVSEELLRDQP